ncbi:MAG: DNA primase [Thermodesulfovibrionales bacterium]|nr:DNA primase [Thermodesulfovibrionales bacterium]
MDYNDLLEKIKEKVDIVDLIAEYIELKKSGQNLKGLCPFHAEKTPSFMVSPTKQIYHCFGCHKGGDIFSFIVDYENVTFTDAVSLLARRAGIDIAHFGVPSFKKGQKEKLYSLYREAMSFYQSGLKNSSEAQRYLKDRNINKQTVDKFIIGFASNEPDRLFKHLKKIGFEDKEIQQGGLAVFHNQRYQDFFKYRIIFPILDISGRCIAFGGRSLSSSKDIPKYINSPDSLIFKKRENAFGLNFAKEIIKQKDYAIIVEGYFDTIVAHQYGFDNTIAPLGTALTAEQLMKIKKFSDKVLLIFDGDSSGLNAAKRAIEVLFSQAIISKILLLPEGEDPDTFLRKNGTEFFKKYLVNAKKPIEFILSLYKNNVLAGIRHILHALSLCPDQLLIEKVINELSFQSKLNELTLRQELKNIIQKKTKLKEHKSNTEELQKVTFGMDSHNKDERILLAIALSSLQRCSKVLAHIDYFKLENETIRGIFNKLSILIKEKNNLSLEDLFKESSEEERNVLSGLSFDITINEMTEEEIEHIIKGCSRGIELKYIEKKIKEYTELQDLESLNILFSEKSRLLSQKN